MLMDWYNSLDFTQQLFWGCAIVASVVFAIQMVLTLIGIDADVDFDGPDFDGDTTDFGGLSLFSIRSLVNFLMGFGWAGVCFHGVIGNVFLHFLASIAVGLAFGSIWFVVRKKMRQLEKNGAWKIQDCLNNTCDVYLRIPGNKSGMGKVQISLGGSIHELNAMTEQEELPTGTKVVVTEVMDASTLLVARA